MTTATIRPEGNSFIVIDADGAEHSFDDIKKAVLDSLHESLHCDIRIVKNANNGNFQLSFGDELYVGVDRNLPREENDMRRSVAIGKRFAFLGVLTNVLAGYGLKFGEHVSPRDTRQVRSQDGTTRWAATTQMWINIPGEGTSSAGTAQATDEDLMTRALAADEEKATAILDAEKSFGEDGKLKTVARARLRAIIAKGKAATTPDIPAPKTEAKAEADESEDMPTD